MLRMKPEAITAGHEHSSGWKKDYWRVQILTIEELPGGKPVQMPPTAQTLPGLAGRRPRSAPGKLAPKAEADKLEHLRRRSR